MVGKKAAAGAVFAAALAYLGYPYVTLYRLGTAIQQGNAPALQSMVDWPSVREGIKEDICDLVIDAPQSAKKGDKLPPFGAGFARGIATNAVDTRVTPEALVQVARQAGDQPSPNSDSLQVSWAFFDGPSAFMVDLAARGQASPIRLRMELQDGTWRVTRVWLPPDLLTQAKPQT